MGVINLKKGGKIMLEKQNDSGNPLSTIAIGLGWDAKAGAVTGADFDLDASVVCLGADGKAIPGAFLYYNSPKNSEGLPSVLAGALVHSGDNLTGDGDGDDETIMLNLPNVPAEVVKLLVVVDIHQAVARNQNFGMAENSYVRLYDTTNNAELIKFDLNFDASTSTGVKFCSIFRKDGAWAFSADQEEFSGGLDAVVNEYAVS